MNNNIILRYLKEKDFDLSSSDLPGITISLDNRLDNDFIYHLIDESYNLVSKK